MLFSSRYNNKNEHISNHVGYIAFHVLLTTSDWFSANLLAVNQLNSFYCEQLRFSLLTSFTSEGFHIFHAIKTTSEKLPAALSTRLNTFIFSTCTFEINFTFDSVV